MSTCRICVNSKDDDAVPQDRSESAMSTVSAVRPVLLTAPYAGPGNAEVLFHLPHGLRTTGLVEITTAEGRVGLGEGYLAVFAPTVFRAIVELVAPIVVGRQIGDIDAVVRDLEIATGYWSFQGAARHVVSAFEIALRDLAAQERGLPLWRSLGGTAARPLPAYASGGDSLDPGHMAAEIDAIAALGIDTFKIRARRHDADKAIWTAKAAGRRGIAVAVDMTQNLAVPSQSPGDVLAFVAAHDAAGVAPPVFLEEVQGPHAVAELPALRRATGVPIAGGEIVTTPEELEARLAAGCYDIVQPDATVVGGVGAVMRVFAAARMAGARVYVHCWGAGVGMLANYHAAIAGGGERVEWPLPAYPLREALMDGAATAGAGHITLADRPGLGARLTPEIERAFPFRDEAVYRCLVPPLAPRRAIW
jgi:L-alanine-DL-glutamate epimerase-like enolase superfamily enzyme